MSFHNKQIVKLQSPVLECETRNMYTISTGSIPVSPNRHGINQSKNHKFGSG